MRGSQACGMWLPWALVRKVLASPADPALPLLPLLPQQECAAPASVTSRRPEPATARMRTSSLSTWTADSRSLVCPGPWTPPCPAPAGPTQEALAQAWGCQGSDVELWLRLM